jgi:hypothetical protein
MTANGPRFNYFLSGVRILVVSTLLASSPVSVRAGGIVETDLRWNEPSGMMHYKAMTAGTFLLTGWLYCFPMSRGKAIAIGASTGLLLGLAKEVADTGKRGGGLSMNDLYHDVAGVSTGIMPFVLTLRF